MSINSIFIKHGGFSATFIQRFADHGHFLILVRIAYVRGWHGSPPDQSDEGVAVGIAVTGYPPRGSGRALLTHPALTLGSGVKAVHWVRVDNSGGGYPAFAQLTEAFPCHSVPLTSPFQ